MSGSRPEQAALSRDNDLSKTEDSLRVIDEMVDALDRNADNMSDFFADDFRWMGNAGCGTKHGLDEFRRNWQLPLRAAFTDRKYLDEARIAQGEWVSCFGHIEATHSGVFMGVPASGKRVKINYMDFWKVKGGKIMENWVLLDYLDLFRQMDVDLIARSEAMI